MKRESKMKKAAHILISALLAFIIFISPGSEAFGMDGLLNVIEPRDCLLASGEYIVVSGESLPETSIIVSVNGRRKSSLTVGAAGLFVTQVAIKDSDNIITVKAISPSGETETVSRRVYKTEKADEKPELDTLVKKIKSFLIFK